MKSNLAFVLLLLIISSVSYAQKEKLPEGSLTGTYHARHCSWKPDEIRILDSGNHRLYVEMDAYSDLEGQHLTGDAWGIAMLQGNVALFTLSDTSFSTNCRISLTFLKGHRLSVKIQSPNVFECFFAPVDPEGMYKRVSKRKPKFEDTDEIEKPSSD